MEFTTEEVVGLFSKQPADFIPNLKWDNGEWKSKDEILAAVRKLQKDNNDAIAKGESGKAVRLRMKQGQNYIKENFGVESDSNEIEDHIKLLAESIQAKAGKEKIVEKTVELTKDLLLKNPIVHEILNEAAPKLTADLQRKLDEREKEYQTYINRDRQKKIDRGLFDSTEKKLVELKADLEKADTPEGIEKRKNQIELVVAGLKFRHQFKLDDKTDKIIPLDTDGEPLRLDYKDVDIEDLVERTNPYRVLEYSQGKGSPSPTTQTPAQQRTNVPVPKTFDEFTEVMKKEQDPDKRKAIMEAFEANTKAAEKK